MEKQFIYDGVDLTSFFIVEKIDRQLVGTIENSIIDVPGRLGSRHGSTNRKSKRIIVTIRLLDQVDETAEQIKDEILPHLVKQEPRKLELPDEPDKFEMCILDGRINWKRLFSGAQVSLSFINPEGISFSKHEKTVTSTSFVNEGSSPTYMILTATATGANPARIVNNNTGDEITLEGLSEGQIIELNFEEESVKVDGALKMSTLWLDSDFWMTSHGENQIELSNLNLIDITYRERWL